MRDRHKLAAARATLERKSVLANNNNKCQRLCVSVIFSSCWLLLAAAHRLDGDGDDNDKWEPPPSGQTQEINSTANSTQDAASNQTAAAAANRAKSPVLGLAELNPDASDTVPVYMQHMTIILCTLHLSVFVTGLVGNSLVCLSVYRNKSLQTITNYYIVNLAVADFLVILICLPPTVYWDLTLTWNFGLVLCKLVLYLQSISVSVSVLTLTCISIDRWYAICRPLKFSSSKSRAKLTIALIWLASLLIASPDVIFLTTSKLYEGEGEVYTDCTYSWPENNTKMYQLCIVTLLFILPFVLMIISYSQIVNVLWRNETMAESMQNSFHLEDEAATAASIGNNGGGAGGAGYGKKLKRRSAKNESVISTSSMAGNGAGHQDNNNGAPRHRWLRKTQQAPAEECADNGRTAGRLCSTCAAAAAAATSTRLSPSNSSNASNASYLVTPSGSFSLRARSFAILKLCRRARNGCLSKHQGPTPVKAHPLANDDAATTGQLVAANIQSHRAVGENKGNLAACQFEQCRDWEWQNSAGGDGDVDENTLVKLNVNNSLPSAADYSLVGLVCSGPASKLDENMEISAGSLVNRGPPFAGDDDDGGGGGACGAACGDNNVSVEISTSEKLVLPTTAIRAKQANLLGQQYDNERASLAPTSTITTAASAAADKIGPEIAGPNQGARRYTSTGLLLLSNNNNDDNDDSNLVLGPNYCEHASRLASSGGPRAKCLSLTTTSRAEKKTRACDRKSAVESAITKSCNSHAAAAAAADCAQCHTDNHDNNNNDDDHDDQNKNNRCHGCRHRQHGQRRHRHHHRRRRATCHELQEPATVSSAKIIITDIKESEPRPVILANAANHERPLDGVETNEPCGPNGPPPNGNYYTRGGRRATTATVTTTTTTTTTAPQDLVDKTGDEAKQGADESSVKSSLAHNPELHGERTAVVVDSANEIKSTRSQPRRRAISAEMPHLQDSAPITSRTMTTTTSGRVSSGKTNELSETTALRQPNPGWRPSTASHGRAKGQGHELEPPTRLDEDDENDGAARLHEQTAAAAAVRRIRNKPNRQHSNRHYHDHHHHHCNCRKHTEQSRRCRHPSRSKGGQSVGGGASLSLDASDATAASVMGGKDEFLAATTGPRGEATKNTSARHYCAECMPPTGDHVRVASSRIKIFALAAAATTTTTASASQEAPAIAATASKTSGLDDAANRDSALSCTGGEQVVVLTRSTENGPLASVVATMAAPAATEIVCRIEAKRSELDTGESFKWPAESAAGHLAEANTARRSGGSGGGQLERTGNDSWAAVAGSPPKDEDRRNLLFIASGDSGNGHGHGHGTGDICARAASGHEQKGRAVQAGGPCQSMKQNNNNSGGGRCTWRSSNIRAAASSACAAMHKSATYERASGSRKGQGWCLDCCAAHERLSPADPPARQEPLSKLSLSALGKQQQQQQQQQHGGGCPAAISCDNRQSNGRLSVKLAPATPDLNLNGDDDDDDDDDDQVGNNKSGGRAAKIKPDGPTETAGLHAARPGGSLQSINQADDNLDRTSSRTSVTCMVANKFLYIRRFVPRLVPSSPATGSTTPGPSPAGGLSCARGKGRASKCRVCHEEIDVGPSRETKVAASVGPPSSDPPTTMGASESHAPHTQREHAPARVSSARLASGSGVHANGSATHQRHAQIHNRSSAPLQGSSSPNAAKSCSLVVQQTIPASHQHHQQQQQHNHYPNHHQPQQQHPHPHPNHSSTRFYKLIESRKKAAKMLIVIVIMFGLCYLPIHFLNTLRYTTGLPQNDITTIASLVSHWLCYFNSAVNPLIYNFMSGKFRHEFANLFFCRFLRRAATNNNQNHYQN